MVLISEFRITKDHWKPGAKTSLQRSFEEVFDKTQTYTIIAQKTREYFCNALSNTFCTASLLLNDLSATVLGKLAGVFFERNCSGVLGPLAINVLAFPIRKTLTDFDSLDQGYHLKK